MYNLPISDPNDPCFDWKRPGVGGGKAKKIEDKRIPGTLS